MRTDVMLALPRAQDGRAMEKLDARGRSAQEAGRLRQVAEEFESLLLENMLKEMRAGGPKSELFGKDPGRKIFDEMLDGEFARLLSKRGGIGIADFMTRSMTADPRIKR